MTFMLGYAWRRQANVGKSASDRLSPTPLAVQASASGDTSIREQEAVENNRPQRQAPPTPEGLRPRKSLAIIREELDVPEHLWNQNEQRVPNWPPMAPLPPRSSPQVTNSSFYSRDSSSAMIAESPDLGQARTAVGALVGMSQGVVSKKPVRGDASDGRLGMLPPRTWGRVEEEEEDSEDISYQQLHDSTEAWTPGRKPQSIHAGSPESTVNSSIHPSPATTAWREWQQQEEQRNVSFSSRAALVTQSKEVERPSYNFDSIVPLEDRQDMHDGPSYVVASDANMANVSILSQSSAPINAPPHYEAEAHYAAHNDSIHSLDSVQNSYVSQSHYNNIEHEEEAMENALMQRKMKNQRRAKEQLLIGAVQRLQHNLDLIADVDALHEEDERWFVKTLMSSEGLLTGFSKDTRTNLRKYIRSILHEMEVARPEEFFLSPSQVPGMAETHDDLHDALIFLDGILQIAVPLSEQNPGQRWTCRPEIRCTMGITSIPESPEAIRGGDTSVFSLPSESATPCTSNVSLATTITSKPSPHRGTFERSTPTHEAGHIRRTIEIVSTLLQKMTTACHQMANRSSSEDSIRATEEVKRNYLQLMTMQSREVRSVVEAFIVGVVDMPLTRQVSVEEDQVGAHNIVNMPLPQAHPKPVIQTLCVAADGKAGATPGTWQDMFSPCTDDMQSARIEPDDEEIQDDLRRTVGSNDYDDQAECRDAPEDGMREGSNGSLQNMVYYTWGAAELAATPARKQ